MIVRGLELCRWDHANLAVKAPVVVSALEPAAGPVLADESALYARTQKHTSDTRQRAQRRRIHSSPLDLPLNSPQRRAPRLLPGARSELAWDQVALRVTSMERGQSTLEWVITAAVVLGTLTTQRNHSPNQGEHHRLA
jgi:hypothetical protein